MKLSMKAFCCGMTERQMQLIVDLNPTSSR